MTLDPTYYQVQPQIKVEGKEIDLNNLVDLRLSEAVSMPPVVSFSFYPGAELNRAISDYLDKPLEFSLFKADYQTDDRGVATPFFKGTITRFGSVNTQDAHDEFHTDDDGLSRFRSYGIFSEYERSIRTTPDFLWSEDSRGDIETVIVGGNGKLEAMQQNRRCRIFTEKKYFDIIKEIASLHDLTVKGENGPSAVMKFVVQYQESDYNFMIRLLKEAGLVYLVEDDSTINLIKRTANTGKEEYAEEDMGYYAIVKARDLSVKSTAVANDPKTAAISAQEFSGLNGKIRSAGNIEGELFESVPEMGDRFIDSEQLKSFAEQASGVGDYYAALGLIKFHSPTPVRPGQNLEVRGDSINVQSVEHYLVGGAYHCVATCVAKDLPYYVQQQPQIPRIHGPQTAKVVSNIDPDGTDWLRVKVQFHWPDEAGEEKQNTAWIRVVQPWAGAEHGTQFIPQPDDEVVVEFMNGDPNFPLITGSVYNGKQKQFYPSKEDEVKTVTGIKTRSNELKIDDATNNELVEITAKKSFHTSANDTKALIQADDTNIKIQHTEKPINVTADQGAITVNAKQSAITVKADANTITLEAGQSITLKVGSNQIVIDNSGITIDGMQVAVSSTAGTDVTSSAITKVQGSLVQIN